MATRSVTFKFINSEGIERFRTLIQQVPDYVSDPIPPAPPIEDPQPLPSPEDIFIDTTFTLPLEPIDFSDMDFNFDFDWGLGDISIGPIFDFGSGGSVQGWNNGDPSNNWGMGAQSVGGTIPINKSSTTSLNNGAIIPPAPSTPVTPRDITINTAQTPSGFSLEPTEYEGVPSDVQLFRGGSSLG